MSEFGILGGVDTRPKKSDQDLDWTERRGNTIYKIRFIGSRLTMLVVGGGVRFCVYSHKYMRPFSLYLIFPILASISAPCLFAFSRTTY